MSSEHCLNLISLLSYVVYWRGYKEFGDEIFKISLTVYQNDILQVVNSITKQRVRIIHVLKVKGLSYLLWMLDCYQTLAKMVSLLSKHQEVIINIHVTQ